MLRDDAIWSGWPDQAELEFIKTVWEVNHGLPKEQQLRIVLVDMKWPWKDIKTRAGLSNLTGIEIKSWRITCYVI